jgi:hypothetical protein
VTYSSHPNGLGFYRCKHCGKDMKRESDKQWVKSYCDQAGRTVHLQRMELHRELRPGGRHWAFYSQPRTGRARKG